MSEPDGGFRGLELSHSYEGTTLGRDFYAPLLSCADTYDRASGYFTSGFLAAAAAGVARFVATGGRMRLICGVRLSDADLSAMTGATADELPDAVADRLRSALVAPDDVIAHRLGVLAWMVREGRLRIRIGVPRAADGTLAEGGLPYFHMKAGIARDRHGAAVAFIGSSNETGLGADGNYEAIDIFTSWEDPSRIATAEERFDDRWHGRLPNLAVFDLPEAVAQELILRAPAEPPSRDVEEAPPPPRRVVARYLRAVTRGPDADATCDGTAAVQLLPHQRRVVARLAGQFPRSWLVADEVGLGKTISAGMALRRLWLQRRARRVLILAPANVCIQWQDELFEKFGLWVPRLDGETLHDADRGVRQLGGANPYASEPILLVSSHTARTDAHRARIRAAGGWDLLIVDEAHHARRRAADPKEYRPTKLLALLDELSDRRAARATWLLTATPMQIHPVELFDLVRHVGFAAAPHEYPRFSQWFEQLNRDDNDVDWALLARLSRALPSIDDPAEAAVLARARKGVGAVQDSVIRRLFEVRGPDTTELAAKLTPPSRAALRPVFRQFSPVGRHVTRHTRSTLRLYPEFDGLLADRDPEVTTVAFSRVEQALYDGLDDLIGRLMDVHGHRRGAGFVLTTYRRRLTSSWAAIERSFRRRLRAETQGPEETDVDATTELALVQELDDEDLGHVDESEAVPLTREEIEEMNGYLDRIVEAQTDDTKLRRLVADIDTIRMRDASAVVFSQFTDTLDYLRRRLEERLGSELALYTGAGGRVRRDGTWTTVSKAELVEAITRRDVKILLATDAASEGLNLQAASWVINYDLPWNPMRVEQRIGRVDRVGQRARVVHIRSYVIPGTVERDVYDALADRIDVFSSVVGGLQPILGAAERAFQSIFRAPRSERAQATAAAITALDDAALDASRSSPPLDDADPLPDPGVGETPLGLRDLARALREDLGARIETLSHPATSLPERVSRDRENWAALLTFGHPEVERELEIHGDPLEDLGAPVAIVDHDLAAAMTRADRVPARLVRSLEDLADLGQAVATQSAVERAQQVVSAREAELAAWSERSERLRLTRARAVCLAEVHRVVRGAVIAEMTLADRSRRPCGPRAALTALVGRDWSEVPTRGEGWKALGGFLDHVGVAAETLLPGSATRSDEIDASLTGRVRSSEGELFRAFELFTRQLSVDPSPRPSRPPGT